MDILNFFSSVYSANPAKACAPKDCATELPPESSLPSWSAERGMGEIGAVPWFLISRATSTT